MYTRASQKSSERLFRVELTVPDGKGGYVDKPVFRGTKKQCEQFKAGVNRIVRTNERFGTCSPPAKPKPAEAKKSVQAKKTTPQKQVAKKR